MFLQPFVHWYHHSHRSLSSLAVLMTGARTQFPLTTGGKKLAVICHTEENFLWYCIILPLPFLPFLPHLCGLVLRLVCVGLYVYTGASE